MAPQIDIVAGGRRVTVIGNDGDKPGHLLRIARAAWALAAATPTDDRPGGGAILTAEHGGSYPTAVTDADPSRTGGLGGSIGFAVAQQ